MQGLTLNWNGLESHEQDTREGCIADVAPDEVCEEQALERCQPDVVQVHEERIEPDHVVRQEVDHLAARARCHRCARQPHDLEIKRDGKITHFGHWNQWWDTILNVKL